MKPGTNDGGAVLVGGPTVRRRDGVRHGPPGRRPAAGRSAASTDNCADRATRGPAPRGHDPGNGGRSGHSGSADGWGCGDCRVRRRMGTRRTPGPPTDGDAGNPGPPTDAGRRESRPAHRRRPRHSRAAHRRHAPTPCLPAGLVRHDAGLRRLLPKHLTKADDGMWPSVVAVRDPQAGRGRGGRGDGHLRPAAGTSDWEGRRVAEVFADWRHAAYDDTGKAARGDPGRAAHHRGILVSAPCARGTYGREARALSR